MRTTKIFIIGLTFSAAFVAGCGTQEKAQRGSNPVAQVSQVSEEDLAAATLEQMLEIAKNGDWESYVDNYYGEQGKFRSPADRDALVKRFEEKWGEKLVQGLDRAAKLPVQIDGDKAMFVEGENPVFILHRSEDGDWKFHL